jgi:hypothetical protein
MTQAEPCGAGDARTFLRFSGKRKAFTDCWIEPKNLKKGIALGGMFVMLHARFQTEGGEI